MKKEITKTKAVTRILQWEEKNDQESLKIEQWNESSCWDDNK